MTPSHAERMIRSIESLGEATIIHLPWPPQELSPNSRTDRRAATRQRKAYREAGFYAAKEARVTIPADAELAIKFFPPDGRRRDMDNMLAAIKSGIDGIAMAAGVDDAGWTYALDRGAPVKGGAVLVQVRPARADSWQSIGAIAQRMVKGQIE